MLRNKEKVDVGWVDGETWVMGVEIVVSLNRVILVGTVEKWLSVQGEEKKEMELAMQLYEGSATWSVKNIFIT